MAWAHMVGKVSSKKGRSYEEIYGIDGALILRDKLRVAHLGLPSYRKGKTLEEIYGPGKAEELRSRKVVSLLKGKTYEEISGPDKAKARKEKFSASMSLSMRHRWANPVFRKIMSENLRVKKPRLSIVTKGKAKPWISVSQLGKSWEERHGGVQSKVLRDIFSNKWLGVKNPNWKNGASFEEYGRGFDNRLKWLVRRRDNCICQLCSVRYSNYPLDVHHLDEDKKNNDVHNLISLCKSCHTFLHHARRKGIFIAK